MKICDEYTKVKPIQFIEAGLYKMGVHHSAYEGFKDDIYFVYTHRKELINLRTGYNRQIADESKKHWVNVTDQYCLKRIKS
jgi:hypothetical protein